MASNSRRIQNTAGSAKSFLNGVNKPNKGENKAAKAIAASGKNEKLTSAILATIKQYLDDSDDYQKLLDSKSIDVTLGRIASLLDEVKEKFVKNELKDVKAAIIDEISESAMSTIFKNFLINQISGLFDQAATKNDIEELKDWLSQNVAKTNGTESSETTAIAETSSEQQAVQTIEENEEKTEDNEEGEYKDSTPAKNFLALQTIIDAQFDMLNKNLKNLPGQGGLFKKLFTMIGAGFSGVSSGIVKLTKGVTNVIGKTASIAKSIVAVPFKGILTGISGLASGIKGIAGGIAGIGKKVGGALLSPFKKIGGFFGKLNPFQRSEKKNEEKKQAAKDKVMNFMAKIIDKIWKVIEPFVDKVAMFMGIVTKFVIVPIALLVMKVLFIVGAIIALAVGLVLAVMWIKNKALEFWNYIVSGKLWKDIKKKISEAWEWTKDFGKWIWQKFISFGKTLWSWYLAYLKFIFVDVWVMLGKTIANLSIWIWDKLCEFGKWLYDNYIDKYLVQPFKTYIWEPIKKLWKEKIWPKIEPFVISLTELKDKIVKAFSAWDTNKSIWENLKNIGGIIKDSIVEWWENSPFKTLWDETVWPMLEPFITSLSELKDRIVKAFSAWNPEISIWENLKNIGGILIDSLTEWYEKSPFKLVIDELVNIVKLYVVAPLKGIQRKLKSFVAKLANEFVIKVPSINFNDSIKPWKWTLDWNEFHPFDFATKNWTPSEKQQAKDDAEKSTTDLINEEMGKMQQTIDEATKVQTELDIKEPNKIEQRNIAAQQVSQAAQPIQNIEKMKNNET